MTITVYSKYNCGKCEFVKRFLKANEIPFTEINVMDNPDQLKRLQDMGIGSLPYVEYEDGNFTGADMNELNKLKERSRID